MGKILAMPPKAPPEFWATYSRHISGIRLSPFEMEEIDRIVEQHGEYLDCYITFGKKSTLRQDMLDKFKTDLMIRAWRSSMLERLDNHENTGWNSNY